jgi:hypothetical protein
VGVRANRAFLGRAVRFLAEEAGLRQFLDIGTGLPTEGNTHQVAQAIAPQSRIVYVDNDPIVLSHATALLKSAPGGACQYINADLRDPAKILAEAAGTLDFSQPIAVMILMTLQYVPDADDPHRIVRTLMDAVPPGSYLAISDVARDLAADANVEASTERLNERLGPVRQTIRSPEEIGRFFDGLELTEPGLVQLPQWRPDLGPGGPVREDHPVRVLRSSPQALKIFTSTTGLSREWQQDSVRVALYGIYSLESHSHGIWKVVRGVR